MIEEQALLAAIRFSGITAGQLTEYSPGGYPELVFPAGYQLECLHRIQAAKELRLEWWAVDLYIAGIAVVTLYYKSSDECFE